MAHAYKITREGAKLFASCILEDALVHAETYATEFAAFVALDGEKKCKHKNMQNIEPVHIQQSNNLEEV